MRYTDDIQCMILCHDDANWMVQSLLLTHWSCDATLFLIKFMSKFKARINRISVETAGPDAPLYALHGIDSPHASHSPTLSIGRDMSRDVLIASSYWVLINFQNFVIVCVHS